MLQVGALHCRVVLTPVVTLYPCMYQYNYNMLAKHSTGVDWHSKVCLQAHSCTSKAHSTVSKLNRSPNSVALLAGVESKVTPYLAQTGNERHLGA